MEQKLMPGIEASKMDMTEPDSYGNNTEKISSINSRAGLQLLAPKVNY